jgi:hypothetical protein
MVKPLRRISLVLSLTVSLAGYPAYAKTDQDLPAAPISVEDWVKEWVSSGQGATTYTARGFALLTRAVVVEKNKKTYKYFAFSPEKAVKQSLLETPEKTSLALAVEINSTVTGDEDESVNPCEKNLSSIAKCFNVDAVLDVTGPKWKLFRYIAKVKKMKMVFERPAGDSSDYFKWIQDQLNFDAVILDSKGDYILALLPTGGIEKEAQALTIKDSARLFGLNSDSRTGTSLISIEEQKGRYGMFKVVVSSPLEKNTLAPGTKIILERSKRIKMPPVIVEPDKAKSGENDNDSESETQE